MGNAQSISQVADIVENVGPCVVVVSATSGTTDQLIKLAKTAYEGGDWESIFEELVDKHEKIVEELCSGAHGAQQFDNLKKVVQGISMIMELSDSALDRVLTFGERISSTILAALLRKRGLKSEAIDAYNLVFTDNNFGEGNVDFDKTDSAVVDKLGALLGDGIIPIVTGFVAQAENGHYITLGRGGSDYTGAILASALNAKELQIWTDVDGIYNADPRLVPDAHVLPQLSFQEAGELAYFGAKVLHPKTIKPAIEKNIPVRILNTFNPEATGTLITNEEENSLKSATYRKGISIINVCSAGMLEARGFLAKLFEVFARNEIAVDVVSTSEVSVSLTVDNGSAAKVVPELEKFASVEVQTGMAIVCLVGGGIRSSTDVLGRLFSSLADHNVSMVSQGASKRNITFLVEENQAQDVVKKVFDTFFRDQNESPIDKPGDASINRPHGQTGRRIANSLTPKL